MAGLGRTLWQMFANMNLGARVASVSEKFTMPLTSLAHLTALDADPIALIDAGERAGFDAVGLRIVPPFQADSIVEVVGNAAILRSIKARLASSGMSILDIEAIWLTPETNVETLIPALETGAELGAKNVIVAGIDAEHGRLTARFAALCSYAQEFGMRVMLEFIPYSTVKTIDEAAALITDSGASNAGVMIDALHLTRSGGSASDIANYDPALFPYIQLCDAHAVRPPDSELRSEARGDRLYPGEGHLQLRDLLAALPPHTPVAVEAPNKSYAHLTPADRAEICGRATRSFLASLGG